MTLPRLPGRERRRPAAWAAFALVLCLALPVQAADGPSEATAAATAWSPDALELAATLPVQEGGRLKPLSSLAQTTLLAFSGRKWVELEDGSKLQATEWLLDLWFAPQVAARHRVFQVADDAVLDALGMPHEHRKKRDWYSFAELEPALEGLVRVGEAYRKIPPAQRGRVEDQVSKLFDSVLRYTQLQGSMAFATFKLPVGELPELAPHLGNMDQAPWSAVLERVPALLKLLPPEDTKSAADFTKEQRAVLALLSAMGRLAPDEGAPALFPPPKGADGQGAQSAVWRSAGDVLSHVMTERDVPPDTLALVRQFEVLGASVHDTAASGRAVRELHASVKGRAEERGEYGRVPLEAAYNRLNPVSMTLGLLLVGFLVSLGWLFTRGRWSRVLGTASWLVVGGCGLVLAGTIVARCIIRSRPPISNLYEVTLFIAATSVIALLVIEGFTRQRLWLTLASFIGASALFVARGYEKLTAGDTMPTLEPVLDTNFWLWIHVTSVVLGYTAGLVAAGIAHVHLLGRAFGLGQDRPAFYAGLTRATYGMICFGLLFSVVGTILGGIWANDSWGRFWGWDPKENGALMICLWELAMLHARMGGYIGQDGLAMSAIVGGVIVAWSYWGVNLLGIGLHSYGFTQGISTALWTFVGIEAGVLAAGLVAWFLRWRDRAIA